MSQARPTWDDLRERMVTGLILVAAGIFFIWVGGWTFALLAAAISGVMVWELARMISPVKRPQALTLGAVSFAVLVLAKLVPDILVAPLLLVPGAAGIWLLGRRPRTFMAFSFGILLAGYGLSDFRDVDGVVWLFWLVLVVAVTDIFGYFGGKAIGGRKFWPRISPKKTWAGVIAGWLAAAITGAVFLSFTDAGLDLLWISVLMSFASQMGDIAQSAVKRREGVKDSSNLLPGHGGLWDRFDGLLGAALMMIFVAQVVEVPEVRF